MKMLRVVVVLAVSLAIVVLGDVLGGVNADDAAKPKPAGFTSKEFGFSLDIADFPEATQFKQVTVVQARAKLPVNGFTPNVNVVVQTQEATPASYLETTKQELENFGLELKEHKELKHSGMPALWAEYQGNMGGEGDLYFVSLAVFGKDRVYLTTGTMAVESKEKLLEKVKKSVMSFTLAQ